jgi:hypothetical protein
VVAAFHLLAVKPAVGKGHAAMRASIMQGEGQALLIASDGKRSFKQGGFAEPVSSHLFSGQGAIPETIEHQGIRGFAWRKRKIVHDVMNMGTEAAYYRRTMT